MYYTMAIFILLAAGCSALNAADSLQLDFNTDPPVGLIQPNVDTAKLSVRVADATGRTVAEPTRFSIELDSPPRNAFFSTGFPIVEGTPLLRGEFNSDSGNLELQYLFPIRGIYRLKVVAESSLGRSEREWNLKMREEPRAVRRFAGLIALLSVFGVVSGICLARSARRRTAGSVSASLVVVLVLLAGLSSRTVAGEEHAHSHGEEHPHSHAADRQTSDNAVVESPAGRMEIRLSPPSATVGTLATLRGEFTPKGRQDGPIEFTLSFVNLDHEREVFRSRLMAPDGTFQLRYQFTDGASHRVVVAARSAADTNAPLAAAMNVVVRAIQPPAPIVARTLLFLLAVTASAMVLGFVGALKFSKA